MRPTNMLSGKKTYLCVAVALGSIVAQKMGYLTADQAEALQKVFGIGALAALRSALPK